MCYLFPASLLFLCCLVLGGIISLSAANWVLVWVGLELNLLSFVPLVIMGNGGQSVEAGVKYFLAQVTGSMVFLVAPFVAVYDLVSDLCGGVVLLGLMVNMGSAPAHQWFPSVIAGIGWVNGYLMMTWQNLAPMWLAAVVVYVDEFNYLITVAILNGVLGAWGGLNQTQLRPLIGYSSVVHLGWMVAMLSLSSSGVVMYWAVYSAILLAPLFFLFWVSAYTVNVFDLVFGQGGVRVALMFAVAVLSLGGMPPFAGFYLKACVLDLLVEAGFVWVGVGLVVSSAVALVFYYELVVLGCVVGVASSALVDVRYSPLLGWLVGASAGGFLVAVVLAGVAEF